MLGHAGAATRKWVRLWSIFMLFFESFLNRKVSLTFFISNTTKLLTEEYIIFQPQTELPKADLLKQSDFISLLF